MNTLRHQRGMSMIEVAVTMAILGVLLATAMPSVGTWIRNTRVRNAAESVQSGLQRTRAEALRRNVNVTFWLVSGADERVVDNSCVKSSSSGSWVISVNDPTGKCATASSSTVDPMVLEAHAAGDGGSGVTVAATSAAATAAQCVRFNGFGQVVPATVPPDDNCHAPSQIAQINFTHVSGGTRNLRIVVSGNGGIRMCDINVASPDPRACPT
jgi:type IV fimbrial biogenesis protein FimT